MEKNKSQIKVKEARDRKEISQEKFGKLFGYTRDQIKNYETGRCRVPGELILKIQDHFNI